MNFLPTTTFSSPLIAWMNIAILVSGVFTVLAVVMMVFPPRFKKDSMLAGSVIALWAIALAAGIGSQFLYVAIQSNLVPQVKSNLVSNLKQKYAINDVDYEESHYEDLLGDIANETDAFLAVSPSNPKSQKIIVFTKSNEKVLFVLAQDNVTSEPTLTEYPYSAGKHSVDSITRK